uniref:Uncharacterized protein n=1 Tax=Oryza barthii TaxID=65489 RepID=A0A0D3FQT2_9ORYZ
MGIKGWLSEEVSGQRRAEEAEVEALGDRGGGARVGRLGRAWGRVVVAPSKRRQRVVGKQQWRAGGARTGDVAACGGSGRAWRRLGAAAERGER